MMFVRKSRPTAPAKADPPRGPEREKAEPFPWTLLIPAGEPDRFRRVRVTAMTRSEARGAAKKPLGIKGRLPVGTSIRVGNA